LRHGKTPYELMHGKQPNLSYFHVFGALCYPTNNGENVGKLQPKADIGIFIGYTPTKKALRIYNRRTRRIVETIHVDFDELTAMASEQSSLGPALQEMIHAEVIAPIAEVIPQVDDDSTGSPSSTAVDQDAPSPSKSLTPTEIQSLVILQDVGNDNLDIEVAHLGNDPLLSALNKTVTRLITWNGQGFKILCKGSQSVSVEDDVADLVKHVIDVVLTFCSKTQFSRPGQLGKYRVDTVVD
nr:retrovirus-related Pol polyprotein from transposon TNT 1-94 [Tanacetum cinerariifolium]